MEDDSSLYFSILENAEWSPQAKLMGTGTSVGAGLAALNDRIVMVWKGVQDDSGLYTATFSTVEGEGSGIWFAWSE